MSTTVFLLVLCSAIFHAGWNFALRRVSGNLIVVWLSLWVSGALVLPVSAGLAWQQDAAPLLHWKNLLLPLLSGVIHWGYFTLLGLAYRAGGIATVYPVARGSGIALTALLAPILFDETISPTGSGGIVLILAGLLLSVRRAPGEPLNRPALRYALAVGITICLYSLVDKAGVGRLNPVFYINILYLAAAILMTPAMLRRYQERLWTEGRQLWRSALLIGGGGVGTYLIILYAYTLGPVSYIVAMREFAVVIGVGLGVIFLKERLTLRKALGIGAIVGGLMLLKVG